MNVITLTPKAVEAATRCLAKEREKNPEANQAGLGISVIGGGCSGKSYSLSFRNRREDDIPQEYVGGLFIFIDPKSAEILKGATLEFHDGLEKSGFEVINPQAESTCGCGKSFC
jgi:iron-sulfur cluster assembly protein/iron-sulfur cluster insertion protein